MGIVNSNSSEAEKSINMKSSFAVALVALAAYTEAVYLRVNDAGDTEAVVDKDIIDALVALSKAKTDSVEGQAALEVITESLKEESAAELDAASEGKSLDEDEEEEDDAEEEEVVEEDADDYEAAEESEDDDRYESLELDEMPELSEMEVDVFDDENKVIDRIEEITNSTPPTPSRANGFNFEVPDVTSVKIPKEEKSSTLFMSLDKDSGVLSFLNIPKIPHVDDFWDSLF